MHVRSPDRVQKTIDYYSCDIVILLWVGQWDSEELGGHKGHVPPQSFMLRVSAPTKSYSSRHIIYSGFHSCPISEEATYEA